MDKVIWVSKGREIHLSDVFLCTRLPFVEFWPFFCNRRTMATWQSWNLSQHIVFGERGMDNSNCVGGCWTLLNVSTWTKIYTKLTVTTWWHEEQERRLTIKITTKLTIIMNWFIPEGSRECERYFFFNHSLLCSLKRVWKRTRERERERAAEKVVRDLVVVKRSRRVCERGESIL